MSPTPFIPLACSLVLLLAACQEGGSSDGNTTLRDRTPATPAPYVMDPHSHARPSEAVITHLDLELVVDMNARRLSGVANYMLRRSGGDSVFFDTDGLEVTKVTSQGEAVPFVLGDADILGRSLRVALPPGAEQVSITYQAGADAKALQWLSPAQTTDKKKPFLFTQGQAILARTWIPVQDSPGIRFTYTATVKVPEDLMALMSAVNPQERSQDGIYRFVMDRPIPAYLIALAVGDIGFKSTGERTGVYAEKSVLDTAAWELADTEKMVQAAESLYGPYRWGRYDVIFLPASFPFGGMENPMLTFATPTILAGDRSLNALIAHELAHSWSGNLVTNATWNDFWLNEGFTMYFEHRITEELYGKDYNDMTSLLGYQDLQRTLKEVEAGPHPEDSKLRLDLAGRDPDDGMTDIAYEKGYALLRSIEQQVGREKFDRFLRRYFDAHAFQGITTDAFELYLRKNLLEPENVQFDLAEWVDRPGLPANVIVPKSDRFVKVEEQIGRWQAGTPAARLATGHWTTFEWMHFLRHLPAGLDRARMDELDKAFRFTGSGNTEILAAWLEQCVRNDYPPSYEKLDAFLTQVGRRKFLVPLYQELLRTDKGRVLAEEIYAHARPNYHSVSVRTIDEMLGWKGVSSVNL